MYITIEDLNLSMATYNALKRAGINDLDDIFKLNDEEILKIRHINNKRLREIKEKINILTK